LYFVRYHEQNKTKSAIAISKHMQTGLVAVIPLTSQINAERFSYAIKIKKLQK